jgi:hypothetical protein
MNFPFRPPGMERRSGGGAKLAKSFCFIEKNFAYNPTTSADLSEQLAGA